MEKILRDRDRAAGLQPTTTSTCYLVGKLLRDRETETGLQPAVEKILRDRETETWLQGSNLQWRKY